MTRIEKTVWQISDMLDFYKKIHKFKSKTEEKKAEKTPISQSGNAELHSVPVRHGNS